MDYLIGLEKECNLVQLIGGTITAIISLVILIQINAQMTLFVLVPVIIFALTLVLVYQVYQFYDMWTNWVAYVDTLTTALFFVGMWLMAKRKIENWYFWVVADIISIPLYLYKGLTFTSIQYFGFTILAIFGFLAWKKNLSNSIQTV